MFIMRMLEFDATVSVYRRKREREKGMRKMNINLLMLSNGLSKILI